MRTRKKLGIAAASLAAAAMVSAGLIAGSSNAFADPTASPTPGSSTKPAEQRTAAPSDGSSAGTGRGGRQGDPGGTHTEVTGTEAEKVTAAVTAQQSGVTVTKVMKDADGSYDVAATKDGAAVRFEVTADLATVTEAAGRGGAGKGGGGGSQDTPVTGAEADKVIAAVTAKDSAVTVTSVRKDPDGSYDAIGTKAGARVMAEVSADLQTVEVRTGR